MRPLRFSVLIFLIFLVNAIAQITLNPVPTRVIGQNAVKLTSASPNEVDGREFQAPQSVVVDAASGGLYVSDTANSRVLGFRNAASFAGGQKADIVIGQPDFTTTLPQGPNYTTRTTGLSAPGGLAVDSAGNLYVVDTANNRVLRFPKPFTQTGDQFPDYVIGQTDFAGGAANAGSLGASTLSLTGAPVLPSLAFDGAGNLWVADSGNNRILRFNAGVLAAATPKPAADIVLGQANFTAAVSAIPALTSLTAIHGPSGIAFDSAGRLFVAEAVSQQRGRVLVWTPPFTNGKAATRMLGVDQSTPPPATVSEFQFNQTPASLFAMGSQIGVVDTFDNRLMIFPPVEQWNLNNFFQSAVTVVGQPTFSVADANQGQPTPSGATLARPAGAYFYNSELYVADAGNNRVIVLPQTSSGFGSATRLLGQLQMDLNAPDLVEGREFNFSGGADAGIAVDFSSATPHLYVADTYNNRILGFNDLRNIQPGAKADIVIGQPDFLHTVSNYPSNQASSSGLSSPTGIVVDSSGNLYVADTGNGRVLRFPKPFENYQAGVLQSADLLLGQISYTTKITDPTSRTMAAPYGLAFAGEKGLLVSDLAISRVLFFAGTSQQLVSSQAATSVFGQSDMNSSGRGSALNQMSLPRHIATDSDDRLYVADTGNNRVLIFDRAPSANSGAYAALQLTTGLSTPRGIHVNSVTGDVWVADATKGVIRFPKFNDLVAGNLASNATLVEYIPLAVAEDNWGNVFVADNANRVVIFYPGLSALNAANFLGLQPPLAYPLAPGLITALYSTGGPSQFGTAAASAAATPLPKQLNGVKVTVNGVDSPLFYAGPDQINFQIPKSTATNAPAEIVAIEISSGRVLGATYVAMNSVSPGVFTQAANGRGDGIIQNENHTLNTATNPAKQGETVTIYLTGQGVIEGMPEDGEVSHGILRTPYTPDVYVGGKGNVPPENVQYSGLAPELVGVWQINVKIPTDAITLPDNPTQVLVTAQSLGSGGANLGRFVFIYIKRP